MKKRLFCLKYKVASWACRFRGQKCESVYRVLMFHSVHFERKKAKDIYSVSLEQLGELVHELKRIGVKFYRFEEFSEGNDHGVSITFDDGYKDNFSLAFPLMAQAEVPFTIFISTDFIGQKGYLNEEEIKELGKSSLVTLGTHGKTHQPLTEMSLDEARLELSLSKAKLESILGRPVETMSFPHGRFTEVLVHMATNIGYKKIATSVEKPNENNMGHLISRQCIYSCDNRFTLRQKIEGLWDWVW